MAVVIQKDFNFEAFSLKLNKKRTEVTCQNLITERTVQTVVEIMILFVFFPAITSKYIYQLSEETLFLSVFDFLGLREPHFQEIKYFFVFVGTVGFSRY